jgi:hypothetical protein
MTRRSSSDGPSVSRAASAGSAPAPSRAMNFCNRDRFAPLSPRISQWVMPQACA